MDNDLLILAEVKRKIKRHFNSIKIDEIHDSVLEAYTKLLETESHTEIIRNRIAWLLSVSRHILLKSKRKMSYFVKFEQVYSDKDESSIDTIIRSYSCNEINNCIELNDLLQNLDDAERQLVVLKDIEGFTFREISELLNCKEVTLRVKHKRALDKLRKILKHDLPTPPNRELQITNEEIRILKKELAMTFVLGYLHRGFSSG